MNSANHAFHALQGIAKSVTPVSAVNISDALDAYAGQDARLISQIGLAASNISEARYGTRCVSREDLTALIQFAAFLKGEFDLVGIIAPDRTADQQHSRDERHFLDKERL